MTDSDRKNDPANPAEAGEPVVSKPYIMPDDPEDGSIELLVREAADSRDKMLRTLAEMENLRRRTEREVADSRQYAVANFARDLLAVADNMRALHVVGRQRERPAKLGRHPGLS